MRHPFLIVSHHVQSDNLLAEVSKKFDLTIVSSGQDGLAILTEKTQWCGMLVAADLPDMSGLDFLEQATSVTTAIPLLLAPEAHLAETLLLANSRSVFRVVLENTPAADLETILLDASQQFDLVQRERQLHAQIARLTLTDPLTGCYNRLHLEEHLFKELSRSIRYSHYLSVILCDIDGLKEVNEAFGHRAGDVILSEFARSAGQLIRHDIDTITRWGEDEFLLVLPETPIRGAGRVANRLREQFAGLACSVDGHRIACTASFGVAGFAPETGERNAAVEDLLLIAGRCLLQAKATGGNQVLCCP